MPQGSKLVQWKQGEEWIYRNVFWVVLFMNLLVVLLSSQYMESVNILTVILIFCSKQQTKNQFCKEGMLEKISPK